MTVTDEKKKVMKTPTMEMDIKKLAIAAFIVDVRRRTAIATTPARTANDTMPPCNSRTTLDKYYNNAMSEYLGNHTSSPLHKDIVHKG